MKKLLPPKKIEESSALQKHHLFTAIQVQIFIHNNYLQFIILLFTVHYIIYCSLYYFHVSSSSSFQFSDKDPSFSSSFSSLLFHSIRSISTHHSFIELNPFSSGVKLIPFTFIYILKNQEKIYT